MTTVPQYTATTTTAGGTVTNSSPLHFDLNTTPNPVRVSPSSGDPQRADFVLVGSRRRATAIECRKITVTIPTGANSPDLTPDLLSAAPDCNLPGWTPTPDTATKTITFAPTSGHAEIGRDQGVTVQLMGMRINTEVGSAPLRIDVEWREAGYDELWETDTTIFDIGKFPPSFHLANFTAEELIIDNGGSVKLNWEASGVSSLRLLYDAADINVMNMTTYTINDISHTTVFYLRATVQVSANTVERTLSTTVTVRVPDLEVGNLRVLGELRVLDKLRVLGELTVARSRTISVTRLGVDEEHPLSNMLDEDLETYYQSKIAVQANDEVTLTLNLLDPPLQLLETIDVYFGNPDGENLPPRGELAVLLIGWTRVAEINPGQRELHWSPSIEMRPRSVRLKFDTASTTKLAIRSFHVSPPRFPSMQVTQNAAHFYLPITAHNGIT
jgi:hypothetical protein